MPNDSALTGATPEAAQLHRRGLLLVATAALLWSSGGLIVRSLDSADPMTTVFWRSVTAFVFLIGFMTMREGRNVPRQFLRMGFPGIVVALCYALASTALIIALDLTSVANVLVIMSSAPLFSALLAWLVLGERISAVSWLAVLATLGGITLMVSDSLGRGAIAGDLVALTIALSQAVAVVTIRRHRGIAMTPAMSLATLIAALAVLPFASPLQTSLHDLALLTVFGAGQLGLGLALFAFGAPLLPAAQTALLNVLEPIFGPIWVWLLIGERPSQAALIGGGIVLTALLVHIGNGLRTARA